MSLRILIANGTLAVRGGMQIATRDLACGLSARGHHVTAFAPTLESMAEELRAAGIPVVSRLADLDEAPAIVHGHRFLETMEALAHFPHARGVFVCHDPAAAHSIPPRSTRIHGYVAVDESCVERLRDDWDIPPSQIRTILSAVDTKRFLPRSPLPSRPTRALVFSNHATPETLDVVRSACAPLGISVDAMGSGAGAWCEAPEAHLGKYDLVFAKARCAIESMAVGVATVLCDAGGSGPMVTSAELPRLRPWSFAHRPVRDRLDAEGLVREINRYDPADAAAVSRSIRESATLDSALDQYEALYHHVMAEPIRGDEGIRQLADPLLARVSRLERELASYRLAQRMQPLADDDLSRVHMSVEQFQPGMVAGASTFVRVRIQNDLDTAIGTWPPFPVHLAYRWRPMESRQFVPQQSLRTFLHRPLGPRESGSHFVRVVAPSAPGRYVLRITLVQEGWRWLDDGPMPVFVETDMMVTRPTLLTSIGR